MLERSLLLLIRAHPLALDLCDIFLAEEREHMVLFGC